MTALYLARWPPAGAGVEHGASAWAGPELLPPPVGFLRFCLWTAALAPRWMTSRGLMLVRSQMYIALDVVSVRGRSAWQMMPRGGMLNRRCCQSTEPPRRNRHMLLIQYEVHCVFALERVRPADDALGPNSEEVRNTFVENLLDEPLLSGGLMREAGHVIDCARFLLHTVSFALWARCCAAPLPVVFTSVALRLRTPMAGLFRGYPPLSALKRWRREHGARRQRRPANAARPAAVPALPPTTTLFYSFLVGNAQLQPVPRACACQAD